MAGNMNAPGGNGNSTFAWQTEDCFDKYLEQALKGAVDAAVSKLSVSCTSLKANALARDHRYFEYWLASRMQQ